MHHVIDCQKIHVDFNNHICLEPKTANTALLRLQSSKSQKKSVEFAVVSQHSAAEVMNVSSLHLTDNDELRLKNLSTNKETEDTVDITSVHAEPGYDFENSMLKDTLHDRAKQEKKYLMTQMMQSDEYDKMTTTTEVVLQGDVVMQNALMILSSKKSETHQVIFVMPGMEKNPQESQLNHAS
ncbi:MAG: hypothetical protein M1835_002725 [Candelina submexicana]|nr:MAG: hypothetical protein M1835_002725 [Candelina submexicana]